MIERVPITYKAYSALWRIFDWLYPPTCLGCGEPLARWCGVCQRTTKVVPHTICIRCGQLLARRGICPRCQENPPSYVALRAWAMYKKPLREVIHRLKYRRDISLAEILARHMVLKHMTLDWEFDLVVPVPQGIARMRERGYNQAALIAWPFALLTGRPYVPKALVKVRETPSQVDLAVQERWENVKQAFAAEGKMVEGKNVLVIDDVTTTGATMEACASALVQAGARAVYGLTAARADFTDGRSRL